jgi:hypothetical protein
MKHTVCVFLFILTFPLLGTATIRPKIIPLNDGKQVYKLDAYLEYFCDTSKKLTYSDIVNKYQNAFTTTELPYVETEKKEKYYWIWFSVQNLTSNEKNSWYFESWGFDIDEIDIYADNGKKYAMGYAEKFNNRPIYHKNFNLLIKLKKDEKKTFFIRIKRKYPMRLNFYIRADVVFMKHLLYEYFFLAVFYGTLGIIVLVNLFLFFRLKDKIHLFYLFCICSEMLYCMGRDGLGFQFLWPAFPALNIVTHHTITQILLIVSTILYCMHFLKLKTWSKNLYWLSLAAILFKGLLFLYSLMFAPLAPYDTFIIDSILLSIPFLAGIIALYKGIDFARYYVIANAFLFFSFITIFLEDRFWKELPFTCLNWYMINVGIFLEAVFLSVALLDQIRIIKNEIKKEQEHYINSLIEKQRIIDLANSELEEKIRERTAAISTKMERLELDNQSIEQINLETEKINELLNLNNKKLGSDIIDIGKLRILLKDVGLDEFKLAFPNENSCLQFLAELKWENGYACKKCGYRRSISGLSPFSRRCKACDYNESPTAHTLFHRLRFDITKAFYMVYLLSKKADEMSLDELSETLDLNKELIRWYKKRLELRKKFIEDHQTSQKNINWNDLILIK